MQTFENAIFDVVKGNKKIKLVLYNLARNNH